jgi:hypothetical protein
MSIFLVTFIRFVLTCCFSSHPCFQLSRPAVDGARRVNRLTPRAPVDPFLAERASFLRLRRWRMPGIVERV